MVHFIRDSRDQTIVDVEVYSDENGNVEVDSTVLIEPYSKFLTENLEDDLQIMRDFSRLQELRGFIKNRPDNPTKEEASKLVREVLTIVANEYDLYYVED